MPALSCRTWSLLLLSLGHWGHGGKAPPWQFNSAFGLFKQKPGRFEVHARGPQCSTKSPDGVRTVIGGLVGRGAGDDDQ